MCDCIAPKHTILKLLLQVLKYTREAIKLHTFVRLVGQHKQVCRLRCRYIASAGVVFPAPFNSTTNWEKANDGLSYTVASPIVTTNSYIELDFGVGGKETDKVRLVNRTINQDTIERLNFVTLCVMDSSRKIMFQHTFSGITINSPAMFDFDLQGRML